MMTLSIFKGAVNFLVNFFGLLSWWGQKQSHSFTVNSKQSLVDHNKGLVIQNKMFQLKRSIGPIQKLMTTSQKKLTEKLTAPLKMESVTIIFSMFRLVTVEILSYGVRYALIIAKMRAVIER